MPDGVNLRERVTIQTRVVGRDGAGQKSTSWEDLGTVWADVRYVSGMQAIKAGADASITRASVRIRLRSDVVPTMQIVHRDAVLDIRAVLPTRDRRWLDLVCEAVANG